MSVHERQLAEMALDVALHILRIRSESLCLDVCVYLEKRAKETGDAAWGLGTDLGRACMFLAVLAASIKKQGQRLSECPDLPVKLSEAARVVGSLVKEANINDAEAVPPSIAHELKVLSSILTDAGKAIIIAERPAASVDQNDDEDDPACATAAGLLHDNVTQTF